jgi:hypothetical protein
MTKILVALFVFSASWAASPPDTPQRYFADGFLDTLQHRTFRYFWEAVDPATGLTPDRYPTLTFSSTAAIGFALTSYGIGAERKYVSRTDAAERVLTTLRYLYTRPQGDSPSGTAGYRGLYYHFLNLKDGTRFNTEIELSTIDTALLMAGVLFCQSYFDGNDHTEKNVRAYADSMYRRIEWQWLYARPPLMSMGWYPERGIHQSDWHGYDESMILYILALGSPTSPIPSESWKGFTSTSKWLEFYGFEFVSFGPLFGHQYSHCWIDFRGIRDEYMREKKIDYFENSRRATYSQYEYGKDNPMKWNGYSATLWGVTACDGPGDRKIKFNGEWRQFRSYAGRGVSADWKLDDGTIAPTAAGGSVAFAPEICVPALKALRDEYPKLWTRYGFLDAFNLSFITPETPYGWYDHDHLGIDQGPIVIMIENLRNGLVWETMKKNPYIVNGLRRAGFTGGWLEMPVNNRK